MKSTVFRHTKATDCNSKGNWIERPYINNISKDDGSSVHTSIIYTKIMDRVSIYKELYKNRKVMFPVSFPDWVP